MARKGTGQRVTPGKGRSTGHESRTDNKRLSQHHTPVKRVISNPEDHEVDLKIAERFADLNPSKRTVFTRRGEE